MRRAESVDSRCLSRLATRQLGGQPIGLGIAPLAFSPAADAISHEGGVFLAQLATQLTMPFAYHEWQRAMSRLPRW